MPDPIVRVGEAPVVFEMEITFEEELNLEDADVTFIFRKPRTHTRVTQTAEVTDVDNGIIEWSTDDEEFLDVDGTWWWQARIVTADGKTRKTTFASIKVLPNL